MSTEPVKEVRHCEHIKANEARPYMRLTGMDYDFIVCWRCQNDVAPHLVKLSEIANRLKGLAATK